VTHRGPCQPRTFCDSVIPGWFARCVSTCFWDCSKRKPHSSETGWQREPVSNPTADGDCHGSGVQQWASPVARSIPSHQPRLLPALPSRTSPGRRRQGGRAGEHWDGRGRGMQGCSHPGPAHCSEGGEEQEEAELRQLLGNSPANLHPVRKRFFPSDWDGFHRRRIRPG